MEATTRTVNKLLVPPHSPFDFPSYPLQAIFFEPVPSTMSALRRSPRLAAKAKPNNNEFIAYLQENAPPNILISASSSGRILYTKALICVVPSNQSVFHHLCITAETKWPKTAAKYRAVADALVDWDHDLFALYERLQNDITTYILDVHPINGCTPEIAQCILQLLQKLSLITPESRLNGAWPRSIGGVL